MEPTPTVTPIGHAVITGSRPEDIGLYRSKEAALQFSTAHHGTPVLPIYVGLPQPDVQALKEWWGTEPRPAAVEAFRTDSATQQLAIWMEWALQNPFPAFAGAKVRSL